jgi:hypothetical protein
VAKNNHPAASLDPSDRANHPFMAIPTPAKARAAARNRIEEMRRDGASASRVTSLGVTVGDGARGGSANAESDREKSSGISDSEDGGSEFADAVAFVFCRLRCLYARERSAPVLAFLG